MAWQENGDFRALKKGIDPTTRHSVLRLLLLANAATLIFALARIAGPPGSGPVPPDGIFFCLIGLSVALSVISFFLPRYPLAATRIGARIVASGLPLGVVYTVIHDVF